MLTVCSGGIEICGISLALEAVTRSAHLEAVFPGVAAPSDMAFCSSLADLGNAALPKLDLCELFPLHQALQDLCALRPLQSEQAPPVQRLPVHRLISMGSVPLVHLLLQERVVLLCPPCVGDYVEFLLRPLLRDDRVVNDAALVIQQDRQGAGPRRQRAERRRAERHEKVLCPRAGEAVLQHMGDVEQPRRGPHVAVGSDLPDVAVR